MRTGAVLASPVRSTVLWGQADLSTAVESKCVSVHPTSPSDALGLVLEVGLNDSRCDYNGFK